MTFAIKPIDDNQSQMKDWLEMAEKIRRGSIELDDQLISYLAAMLSTQISERLDGKQSAV